MTQKTNKTSKSDSVKSAPSKSGSTKSAPAKSKTSNAAVASVIGGIAAAAAIGGYFLYHNKNAQKKIKSVKGWALKAKGEILEKVEKLKEVNEGAYHSVVDAVTAKYEKLSHIDAADIAHFSKELKSHWNSAKKELTVNGKKAANKAVSKTQAVVGTLVNVAKAVKKEVAKSSATTAAKASTTQKAKGMKKA